MTSTSTNNSIWGALDKEVGTITAKKVLSENGSVLHSTYDMVGGEGYFVEGTFVTLFSGSVRGCSITQYRSLFDNVLGEIEKLPISQQAEAYSHLCVCGFHLRDTRSIGKGEREMARWHWLLLSKTFPKTTLLLLESIPEYGYWKDLNQLIADLRTESLVTSLSLDKSSIQTITQQIYKILGDQLQMDYDTLCDFEKNPTTTKPELSLLAKWFPKEGRSFDRRYKMTKRVAEYLFPELFQENLYWALKRLRKMVSKVNKAINTTETLMHEGQFSKINFNLVPGRCLNLKRRSFLNLIGGSKCKSSDPRSSDEDRVLCAQNLEDHMEKAILDGNVKIHGKRMFPHELVEKIQKMSNLSEIKLMELQWKSILQDYQSYIDTGEIDLDGVMTLVDISGSMYSSCGNSKTHPVMVAVALGILFSQLGKKPFGNRFMAFSETPTWTQFKEEWGLKERVNAAFNCNGHGFSTDYLACHDMILDMAERHQLQPEDLPKVFLTLSDMQFNAAMKSTGTSSYKVIGRYIKPISLNDINPQKGSSLSYRSTYTSNSIPITTDHRPHHEILVQAYHDHGIKVCGKPYIIPRTVYWNLRGDTKGCVVQADTPNTQLVSGFSPNMLIPVMKNDYQSTINEDEDEDKDEAPKVTPGQTFKDTMNHVRYDPIRKILEHCGEGVFRNYRAPDRPLDDESSQDEGFVKI
jgi:hypothetical protein